MSCGKPSLGESQAKKFNHGKKGMIGNRQGEKNLDAHLETGDFIALLTADTCPVDGIIEGEFAVELRALCCWCDVTVWQARRADLF